MIPGRLTQADDLVATKWRNDVAVGASPRFRLENEPKPQRGDRIGEYVPSMSPLRGFAEFAPLFRGFAPPATSFSPFGTALLTLLLCLSSSSTPLAFAQGEDLVEEEELIIDDGFEIAASNFDQWIFGSQNSQQGQQRVESQLALQVEAINRTCGLTEAQTEKLQLAGQGDLKRFFNDVAVVRKKFIKVRRNRNAFNQIWQDIQPLQAKINSGLFTDASFFRKVLDRTLSDEQSSKYEETMWERRQFRYNAKLTLVVTMLERGMPLRADQREQFISVLKEETKPPKAFGQYDYHVVLYQLTKIPDEKLKPIFDEPQWKVLKQQADQARGREAWLKQQKILP